MRVLIVDDEPLARSALATLLAERADVEGFEVAEDAHEALERLRARPFDVLLLDIQMPTLTGLQMIEHLSQYAGPKPSVVFITAYAEHAVEAFEKRAVDYVLKPIVPARVHEALDVAARRSAEERAGRLLDMLGNGLKTRPERAPRVALRDKARIVFVDLTELVSAEAQGNYVLLQQQKSGSYLLRETLAKLAETLGPHGFIRIHRSVLVNVAFVEAIEPGIGSEYILRTRTGREYHVSRTYRDNLRGLAQFWIGTEGFGPG
jgi:two-component system LytT family response regulator